VNLTKFVNPSSIGALRTTNFARNPAKGGLAAIEKNPTINEVYKPGLVVANPPRSLNLSTGRIEPTSAANRDAHTLNEVIRYTSKYNTTPSKAVEL
jgi:hypothetical protein